MLECECQPEGTADQPGTGDGRPGHSAVRPPDRFALVTHLGIFLRFPLDLRVGGVGEGGRAEMWGLLAGTEPSSPRLARALACVWAS